MNDDFSWLDYDEKEEPSASSSDAGNTGRRGLRRFLPRLPRPRLPGLRLPRPRLPRLRLPRLPRLRRGQSETASAQPSAADILSGQADRPIAELDNRLQALRDRSVVDAGPSPEAHQALYDVDEVLVTPAFQQKPGGVISAVALSKAQQQQVEMLKDIVGGPLNTQDGGGSGRRILSRPLPIFSIGAAPRLIATSILILAVSLPFVSSDFAEGALPPADFGEDRPNATTVYDLLDNLSQDDYVLVAFEYGPTAAGELDALADLFLRHIFAQLAKPVIVSSNPIAIVHAQNLIAEINRSVEAAGLGLENNRDYFILRYLPGGALGLRELSENFDDVSRVSAKGVLTGLEFSALDEMSLILLIAESAEDMRLWAEQVLPETDDARLLAATGYAAEPLAQAYADSLEEIVGLIVGFRDAYTYGEKLATTYGGFNPSQPPNPLPQEPVIEPVPVNEAPEAQEESEIPTAVLQPTATTEPTATPFPTSTPLPTDPPPTDIPPPTDTPVPTATSEPVLYVEVIAQQLVNIRRGPTTADDILTVASAGDRFEVLGTNGDGSWYNILLPNGLEAWIAAFLVQELLITPGEEPASASAPRERTVMRLDFTLSLGKNQPRFYQALPPDTGDQPEFVQLRDRRGEAPRLEAMTLGTLGAVLVIVIGNLVSALRAFGQRRREPGQN